MKTAHTIPWEAVVQGCPPSQAKRLPLVIAKRCEHVDPSVIANLLAGPLAGRGQHASPAQNHSLAMIARSPNSCLVELPLPQEGAVVQLTSDNNTSVILQAFSRSIPVLWDKDAEHRRDTFTRRYVARYARFDPDERAFTPNIATEEEPTHPRFEFINPAAWGFTPITKTTSTSMHWTAHNLFRSPTPPKTPANQPPATRQRFKDIFDHPTIDRGDPFQCIPQLRQIRTLCQNTASQAQSLALSLGRCRLFGVRLADAEDFTLSPLSFDHAASSLIENLKEACEWAIEVESAVDTYSAYLLRNLALELLEIRMDAHATYLALDEAYAAAIYECEPTANTMGRRLNQVRRVINLFDGNLQKQLPLLRLAASTFLLENWRRLLAPSYRELPPWWLDGCLE